MKSDSAVRRDVEAELQWTPDVDHTDITINIRDGVVALGGYVKSYFEKYRAEDAVKGVVVAGVANDIVVHPQHGKGLEDPEIARAALRRNRRRGPHLV